MDCGCGSKAELLPSTLKALSSVPSNGGGRRRGMEEEEEKEEEGEGRRGGGRGGGGGRRIGTVQASPARLEHSLLSLFSFPPGMSIVLVLLHFF